MWLEPGFLALSGSAVNASSFNMQRHVVLAVFCVLVLLYVVFLNNLDPVLRLVRVQNNSMMEQHLSSHEEHRLERGETTKRGDETTKTYGIEQGLIMLNYSGIKGTTTTMEVN